MEDETNHAALADWSRALSAYEPEPFRAFGREPDLPLEVRLAVRPGKGTQLAERIEQMGVLWTVLVAVLVIAVVLWLLRRA